MSATIKAAILSLKSRIADAYTAISAKGGTLPATQDSANLPTAIASIPTGGGEPEPNDFNFVDFNGLQQSYSKAEIDAMTELPSPKVYPNLTFDGWTRTLSELKQLSCCTIGAFYKPTDGNTHIIVEIPEDNYAIRIGARATGQKIAWGDGEESTPAYYNEHTYTSKGEYEIILYGCTIVVISDNAATRRAEKEIYYSEDVTTIDDQEFRNRYRLEKLCFPKNISTSVASVVVGIYGMQTTPIKSLVLPSTVTGGIFTAYYQMNGLWKLKYIVADGVTQMGNRMPYQQLFNLVSFSAKSVTSCANNEDTSQSRMANLQYVQYDSLQTLDKEILTNAIWVKKVDFPSTLTSISKGMGGTIDEMYLRSLTPPALSSSSLFAFDTYAKIHVSANATYTDGDNITWTGVDAYEHATNWSAYTGKYIADL